jgi:hypothetical protein
MDEYMSALFLPHTHIDTFPTVAALLTESGLNGAGAVREGDAPLMSGDDPVKEDA